MARRCRWMAEKLLSKLGAETQSFEQVEEEEGGLGGVEGNCGRRWGQGQGSRGLVGIDSGQVYEG